MLCFFALLAVIAAFITVLGLIIAFARSDGDLLLMFMARFGKQPESLTRKVVWITGASSGIGEYIAYCLAGVGCRLVLSARRNEELEKVKQKCLQTSKGVLSEDDIMILPLDVAAFETHKPAVEKVIQYFNKIDILINNAGKSQRAKWMDTELSIDRELFEINVLGPVNLTQEVLPHMIERKQGHIVVNSSLAAKFGIPNSRSYTGAKFAVNMFLAYDGTMCFIWSSPVPLQDNLFDDGYFECLRTEICEHNIDVTLLCPGPVHSNLYQLAAKGKQGEVFTRQANPNDKKMKTDRCAYLSCVAIANKLYESWVSEQPFLTLPYLIQYLPVLGQWYLKKKGVSQLMKMREGH